MGKRTNTEKLNRSDHEGYRSIFKATSIFGGVQVVNIIVSLIRGKVLAILIGTAGMGLNGLFLSTLNLITRTTSLGIDQSAVRDISAAYETGDQNKIRNIYTVFKRWIWLTAILGVVITISLSTVLSQLTFGDKNYTVSFLLLSATLLFGALTNGVYTLLRGMRKISLLAQASISGSVAGLLVAIPIFYFYGIDGVVPAIIASSFSGFLVAMYFRRKVIIKNVKLSLKDTFTSGKSMVALGMALTVSSFLTAGVKYIMSVYISKEGSIETLGIYNAANSIMTGYVGMIFTAVGTDYYPRLSGVISNPGKWKSLVNQQAEIIILILGPVLAFILLSAPILIRILLSLEFLSATEYIVWASPSILLKSITWVLGFLIISKGDTKLFLYIELAGITYSLFFSILFFNLLGIAGLGLAENINYFISAILLFIVIRAKYSFVLSNSAYRIAGLYILIIIASASCIVVIDYPDAYYLSALAFIIISLISLRELNKRMDLKTIYRNLFNRFKS